MKLILKYKKEIIISIIFVIALAVFISFGSTPQNEIQNSEFKYAKSSMEHILGNDSLGRDMFIRICYAVKNSISIAILSIITCIFIAILYGAYAGYAGGKTEKIMIVIMNIIGSIPDFLVAIFLMMFFNVEEVEKDEDDISAEEKTEI